MKSQVPVVSQMKSSMTRYGSSQPLKFLAGPGVGRAFSLWLVAFDHGQTLFAPVCPVNVIFYVGQDNTGMDVSGNG